MTKRPPEISQALNALRVAVMMLNGECQHGYNTAHSARGCDMCAEQIEDAKDTLEHWSGYNTRALDATQDLPRMVAFVSDMRTQLNPIKAVEYFNQYFPEIGRLYKENHE